MALRRTAYRRATDPDTLRRHVTKHAGSAAFSAFRPVVQTIATESRRFGKPVYLLNGDSHIFTDDRPLDGTRASPSGLATTWTSFYGVPAVPNLRRVTVDGSADALNYLRVTVDEDAPEPLSWVRVPFTN